MKKWKFTPVIAALFSLAACSKDHQISEEQQLSTPSFSTLNSEPSSGDPTSDVKRSYYSGWEKLVNWTQRDNGGYMVYSTERVTPQISEEVMNSGAVLVFAKNYRSDEGDLIPAPSMMSFNVGDRPEYFNEWKQEISQEKVKVKFQSNKEFVSTQSVPAPDSYTRFRFFVIPDAELTRLGYTRSSIQQIRYDKLVDILNATEFGE